MKDGIRCKFCSHFENQTFDNKRYGYCQILYHELYGVDENDDSVQEKNIVTNEDFGCMYFEEKTKQKI